MKMLPKCIAEGCIRLAGNARGMCVMHYNRWLRHGDMHFLRDQKKRKHKCKAEGCENKVGGDNYCETHYQRMYRYGRLHNVKSTEGRWKSRHGYIFIWRDGRSRHEHTYLAEQALGKPLPPGAVVHHMNEDKTDNYTPFNLILCPDQAYHKLLHKRMRELEYANSKS